MPRYRATITFTVDCEAENVMQAMARLHRANLTGVPLASGRTSQKDRSGTRFARTSLSGPRVAIERMDANGEGG